MNRVSVRFNLHDLADEMIKVFHTMDDVKTEVLEFKRNATGIEQNQSSAVAKALKTLARARLPRKSRTLR